MNDNSKKTSGDTVDEFLSRYRRIVKHTETVRTFRTSDSVDSADGESSQSGKSVRASDRTMEIDPRATFNPVTQRQIITKKASSAPDGNTDYDKKEYTDRFVTEPELKASDIKTARTMEFDPSAQKKKESDPDTVEGQQTFASFFGESADKEIKRSIKITSEPEEAEPESDGEFDFEAGDDIASLYKTLNVGEAMAFGKSEKLRAIARTAGDDREVKLENQLTFPGFESEKREYVDEEKLEKDVRKNRIKKVRDFMLKGGVEKQKDEENGDIAENVIITNVTEDEIEKRERTASFKKFQGELSRFVKTHDNEGIDPGIEYSSEHDVKSINAYIRSGKRKSGILVLLSGIFGIALLIMSLVSVSSPDTFMGGNTKMYAAINFFPLVIVGLLCCIDLRKCFSALKQKRFASDISIYFMFLFSAVQCALIWFYPDTLNSAVPMLAPAAILSALPLYGGRYVTYNNIQLCFNRYSGKDVLNILRPFGDGGLAKEMIAGLQTPGGNDVKYTAKAKSVSGFMRCAVNAVPPDPYADAVSFSSLCVSVLVGAISGIIRKSAVTGFTSAAAILILSVPVTYIFITILPLFRENLKLYEKKASVPSYSVAGNISKSTAVIFSSSNIIEQSACSIHGVKTFGSADAEMSVLYAAALVMKAHTPLEKIFSKAVNIEDIENLNTEDIVYEEKLGLSSWIDNNRVLFGSEDLMRHHNIPLPSGDIDIYKEGSRKIIFLAVNDSLKAMFVVSYHIKRSVSQFLRELTKRGMAILVDTMDQNITEEFLEKKCKLPQNSVRVIGVRIGEYYRQTASVTEPVVPVGGLHSGTIASESSLIESSFRLSSRRRVASSGVYTCAVIGTALVTVLAFCSGLTLVGSWQIVLFRLFWLAFGLITPAFIKK